MAYLFVSQLANLLNCPKQDFPFGIEFIFAYLLSLFGTGFFAFIGFAYPTSRLIGSSYYKLRNLKMLTLTYNVLGVKYFKYLLLLFFWGTKNNRKKYFDGTKSSIKIFVYQTHQSEFGHLGGFLLLLPCSLLLAIKGYFQMSVILFIINIIGNFYPIILQRYHRIRIKKLFRP